MLNYCCCFVAFLCIFRRVVSTIACFLLQVLYFAHTWSSMHNLLSLVLLVVGFSFLIVVFLCVHFVILFFLFFLL